MKRLVILLMLVAGAFAGLVAAAEVGMGPLVITHEDEQKIVLRFGSPVSEGATTPGLSLRIPVIDEVRTFDRRWLYLNTEPLPIQTVDGERLVVDNYVVWRIADPLAYHKSFPTGRSEAELRIDRVVRADVREEVAKRDLASILTTARVEVMDRITRESDTALRGFGIEVSDVRINRTELPEGTIQNVYARMRAERERLARQKRAEGEEEARRIRAEADREARVTVAEARRDAEILRGEGDAEAARIYADAYDRDPDFFYFVRRLEAYRKTIGEGTTLVLPPSHEFFRLFEGSEFPQRGGAAGDVSAGDASEAPGAERAE